MQCLIFRQHRFCSKTCDLWIWPTMHTVISRARVWTSSLTDSIKVRLANLTWNWLQQEDNLSLLWQNIFGHKRRFVAMPIPRSRLQPSPSLFRWEISCCWSMVWSCNLIILLLIQTAVACKQLHNYFSLFAVMLALQSTEIIRLRAAWLMIGRDIRKAFHKMQELIDTSKNMKVGWIDWMKSGYSWVHSCVCVRCSATAATLQRKTQARLLFCRFFLWSQKICAFLLMQVCLHILIWSTSRGMSLRSLFPLI